MKKFWPIVMAAIICIAGAIAIMQISANKITEVELPKETDGSDNEQIKEPPKVATKDELLAEVNRRRAEVGAVALQYSAALGQSAQVKCDDMVSRNYYGHIDPDGKQGYQIAIDYSGLKGHFSENLMMQSVLDDSATAVFNGWFGSADHKEAALDSRQTLTGFGICGDVSTNSASGSTYFVEHFYSPTNW